MSHLVSIVVPIHNIEDYLRPCLDSLLAQSHEELDILCIDDASSDSSKEVIEEYAQKDNRIRPVYLDSCIGLGDVRNRGIDESRGEYVCFIDGDDFIDQDFVERLLQTALDHGSDISKCQIKKTDENGNPFSDVLFPNHTPGNFTTLSERMSLFNFWFGTTNSLIRTELLREHQIRFLGDHRFYEDFTFYIQAYYHANQVSYFDEDVYYYYRIRSNSINNDPGLLDKRIYDSLYVTSKLLEFCDEKQILLGEKKHIIRKIFLNISSPFVLDVFGGRIFRQGFINFLKRHRLVAGARKVYFLLRKCHPRRMAAKAKRHFKSGLAKLGLLDDIKKVYRFCTGKKPKDEYDMAHIFEFLSNRMIDSSVDFSHLKDRPVNLLANPNVSLETFFRNGSYHEIHRDYVIWGASHLARTPLQEIDGNIWLCEDGFISSIETWANTDRDRRFYFCCSFLLDRKALHFSAFYPSELEMSLNAPFSLSKAEEERSRRLIDQIVSNKISKYNFQPLEVNLNLGPRSHKVLVIDQSFGDASIINSNASPETFQSMIKAAVHENPGSDIVVKVHPDALVEGPRKGYYDKSIKELSEQIILCAEPVNPVFLLEQVDKVYVCSSGMGMEALLCGKEVVTFGVPFYSGWGLTDDRNRLFRQNRMAPRRSTSRSLEELFHKVYIEHSIYKIDEMNQSDCEIEEVLDYLLMKREAYFVRELGEERVAAHQEEQAELLHGVAK